MFGSTAGFTSSVEASGSEVHLFFSGATASGVFPSPGDTLSSVTVQTDPSLRGDITLEIGPGTDFQHNMEDPNYRAPDAVTIAQGEAVTSVPASVGAVLLGVAGLLSWLAGGSLCARAVADSLRGTRLSTLLYIIRLNRGIAMAHKNQNANTPADAIKDPREWTTGEEPMTGAQDSYVHTLARQAGEEVGDDMTKAEASEKIDKLREKTGKAPRTKARKAKKGK